MALWQHNAAVAAASIISSTGYGNIGTRIGTAAVAMSWIGAVMLFVIAVSTYVTLISIPVLDRLTAD
jgi:hypothetical protein